MWGGIRVCPFILEALTYILWDKKYNFFFIVEKVYRIVTDEKWKDGVKAWVN